MREIPKSTVSLIGVGIFVLFFMASVSAYESTMTRYIMSSSSNNSYHTVKATSDNNIVYFDNANGISPWSYNTGLDIGAVAISDDGSYVVAGCYGQKVFFFNKRGDLLWKRTVGNSSFTELSISADNSFIDLTTDDNQVFSITRGGNQVDPMVRRAGIPTPPPTHQPLPTLTVAPTPVLPIIHDFPADSGNYTGFLILIAVIFLVVWWVIMHSHQKTLPEKVSASTHQLMTISAESVPEGADIFVNGIYQGKSPVDIRNLPSGLYTIKATMEGYATDSQQMSVTSGQSVWRYTPMLKKNPRP